jgi:hypothetical protein
LLGDAPSKLIFFRALKKVFRPSIGERRRLVGVGAWVRGKNWYVGKCRAKCLQSKKKRRHAAFFSKLLQKRRVPISRITTLNFNAL